MPTLITYFVVRWLGFAAVSLVVVLTLALRAWRHVKAEQDEVRRSMDEVRYSIRRGARTSRHRFSIRQNDDHAAGQE